MLATKNPSAILFPRVISFSFEWSFAQRPRASAAWPATRNGNALAMQQRSGPRPLEALVGRHVALGKDF